MADMLVIFPFPKNGARLSERKGNKLSENRLPCPLHLLRLSLSEEDQKVIAATKIQWHQEETSDSQDLVLVGERRESMVDVVCRCYLGELLCLQVRCDRDRFLVGLQSANSADIVVDLEQRKVSVDELEQVAG